MSLALLFNCLPLNMFRMLVHPPAGACDLLWIYLMRCIALVRCVLVLRCGSAGVVWYCYPYPSPYEPEQYNPRDNSTNKSQAPEERCTNIRNMLSSK